MQMFYIVPVPEGGQPPSVWPGPGHPAHPIAPGGPPPGVWPGPGYPAHPIAPGGPPPGVWPSPPVGVWPDPGYPAHPIAPGGPPPGVWPGPGYPAHPIAPGGPPPGFWGGVAPPGFWGGAPIPGVPIVWPNPPGDYKPEHPIVLPPGAPEAPMNPSVMPPGTLQPAAPIPGSGSVWLLGYFPGLDWRWVTVDAGTSVQPTPPPAVPKK